MPLAVRLVTALALWSSANLLPLIASAEVIKVIKEEDYCLSVHDDLQRRQNDEWGNTEAFTIADGTKHTPFTFFDPATRQATVIIGNGDEVGGVFHPMVASDNPSLVHFITYIYAVDQNGNLFAMETLDPNQPVPITVVFDVPEGVTEMTAYEFCNLHGLWAGSPVSTLSEDSAVSDNSTETETATTSTGRLADDEPGSYLSLCDVESPIPVAFDSFAADFVRRQSLPPFNSLEPYTQENGVKHTPFIQLHDNGTATVRVGIEGNYHVMQGAAPRELDATTGMVVDAYDASALHWITDIYVVDQTGRIVTMQSMNPEGVDMAQITFEVPQNATTLTAYEWCNVHGLYMGPTVTVGEETVVEEEGEESSGTKMTMGIAMIMAVVAAAVL